MDSNNMAEPEYWLNEKQVIMLTMLAPGDEAARANEARHEIVQIIHAWRRGKVLPRSSTPVLNEILQDFSL